MSGTREPNPGWVEYCKAVQELNELLRADPQYHQWLWEHTAALAQGLALRAALDAETARLTAELRRAPRSTPPPGH